MRKRILSLILALAMTFSLAATVSVTASAETSGDFEYSLLADLRLQAIWVAQYRLKYQANTILYR